MFMHEPDGLGPEETYRQQDRDKGHIDKERSRGQDQKEHVQERESCLDKRLQLGWHVATRQCTILLTSDATSCPYQMTLAMPPPASIWSLEIAIAWGSLSDLSDDQRLQRTWPD